MRRLALGACALALLGMMVVPAVAGAPVDDKVVIGVTGMTWGASCTKRVRATLGNLPNIKSVAVDFKARTATISGSGLDKKAVTAALKKSGFGVSSWTAAAKPRTYLVKVTGMTWGHSCAKSVRATLTRMVGVKNVDVNFQKKVATVHMKKGKLTKADVVAAFGKKSRFGVADFKEKKAAAHAYAVGISGMTWGFGCGASVRAALNKIQNVKDVKVDFAKKTAKVTLKSGKLTRKTVAAALPSRFGVTSFDSIR